LRVVLIKGVVFDSESGLTVIMC